MSSPRTFKQAALTPSRFQGGQEDKQIARDDGYIWWFNQEMKQGKMEAQPEIVNLKILNDSVRDQVFGFDFPLHVWNLFETTSLCLIRVCEPAHHTTHQHLMVRTRGRHIFPNLDQPSSPSTGWDFAEVVLFRTFHEKLWKRGGFTLGGLAHGLFCPKEISKESSCPVHISIFWEEPKNVLFHLATAKEMNPQSDSN